MADGLQNIGNILAGFGAGVQGRGTQFLQGLEQQREVQRGLSEERKQALVQDVAVGLDHLESGRTSQAIQLFEQRLSLLGQDPNADPEETRSTLEDLRAGKFDKVKDNLKGVVRAAQIRGLLPDTPTSKFLKVVGNKALFQTPQGELEVQDLGEAGIDASPIDVKKTEFLPGGAARVVTGDGRLLLLEPSEAEALKITEAEARGAELQGTRAEQRARGAKQEQRAQALITRGTTAAESTAIIRRGLELLETIETGGPQAISLAIQQRLGIEGADAGELSNSLGKAVLSQLRETFGAAFTAEEGKQLTRIEAGFGKSTAANKRLLQRALKIAERTSNRAIRAAKDRGDEASVEDIEDLLKFEFMFDEEGAEAAPTAQPAPVTPTAQPATIGRFEIKAL